MSGLRATTCSGVLTISLLAAGCVPSTSGAVRVFAPRCSGQSDLEPYLGEQIERLDLTLKEIELDYRALEEPRSAELRKSVEDAGPGWFLLIYTGHGSRPGKAKRLESSSSLCLASDGQDVDKESAPPSLLNVDRDLIAALPRRVGAATFILDACESAHVDPRGSDVPLSVISSSPYVVSADSLFGDRLALALRDAASDPNCDGLVTDQEVFDALLHILSSEISLAADRAYPKLRRNATSHLPLPVAPRVRVQCAGVIDQVRTFVKWLRAAAASNDHVERSRDLLANALDAQLRLEPFPQQAAALPESDCDYFIIDSPQDVGTSQLRELLRTGLCEFPASDLVQAGSIARFAIFAEVYRFSPAPPRAGEPDALRWVRITRLRDNELVAVRQLKDLKKSIPQRRHVAVRYFVDSVGPSSRRGQCHFRHTGKVPISVNAPVPCNEPAGQCFEAACQIDEELADD